MGRAGEAVELEESVSDEAVGVLGVVGSEVGASGDVAEVEVPGDMDGAREADLILTSLAMGVRCEELGSKEASENGFGAARVADVRDCADVVAVEAEATRG